jgi:hypothetical protein
MQIEIDRLHQYPEFASDDDPWQRVSALKRLGRTPSRRPMDPSEIVEWEPAMTTKAWRKKESWLNLAIFSILVAMLGILLQIETRPRQNQSASHEYFSAQIAHRR